MTFGPAIFDRYILALDIAGFVQALTESINSLREAFGRAAMQKSDHRYRLLGTRREGPTGGNASTEPEKVPPSHGAPFSRGPSLARCSCSAGSGRLPGWVIR